MQQLPRQSPLKGVIKLTNPSPAWRTEKIAKVTSLECKLEIESKKKREAEIAIAELKERLKSLKKSALPILLFTTYEDHSSAWTDIYQRQYFYYLPDLETVHIPETHNDTTEKSNIYPNTLDLRDAFKNYKFGTGYLYPVYLYSSLKTDERDKKRWDIFNHAVADLKAVIDHLFACENIPSWDHLRERLAAYYFPDKTEQ